MNKIHIILITIVLLSFPDKSQSQTLHLYGGKGHDKYLGCLNCSDVSSNSIWNEFGEYGSSYNSNSIWNEYGTYGSEYSSTSPWNEYASDPPVVVDRDGNFYGYLCMNEYKTDRAEFKLALYLYEYHELMRENPSKWYEKLFQ